MNNLLPPPTLIPYPQRSTIADDGSEYLTAKIASTAAVHQDAYSLRHASYLAYGYLDAMPDGLFADDYDDIPTSKTIIIYKDKVPVASARVTLFAPESDIAGADRAPDCSLFQAEMTAFMREHACSGKHVRAADISRLSRHPDYIDDKNLTYASFRMVGYVILHFGADVIFAAVRPHHLPFYRRMGFRLIASPRPYPNLNFHTGLVAWTNPDPSNPLNVLPILDSVSVDDPEYKPFLAGDVVPVRSSAAALRMNKAKPKIAEGVRLV